MFEVIQTNCTSLYAIAPTSRVVQTAVLFSLAANFLVCPAFFYFHLGYQSVKWRDGDFVFFGNFAVSLAAFLSRFCCLGQLVS